MVEAGYERESPTRVPWAVPEVIAASLLIAVALVALGGLIAGIDVASSRQLPIGDSLQSIWNSVSFGASWAEPLVAVVLLGVIGLCWWQADRWLDDEDVSAANGYVARARYLGYWAAVGLAITAVGAVANLVAIIGLDVRSHPGQLSWARVIPVGAGAVAVLVLAIAGQVAFRGLGRESLAA